MPRLAIVLAVVAVGAVAGFLAGRWWPANLSDTANVRWPAAAGLFTGRWWPEEPPEIYGGAALFGEERPLPEFTLTDHAGRAYTRRDLGESWTLLFFGYTHCPDVCPITLATTSASMDAVRALGGEPPRVVFVSVDPERDTPRNLGGYVAAFGEDVLGVTGPHDQLRKLTRALGVAYAREDGDSPGYLVEHSAALLLVNPEGELQAVFTPPHEPDVIARDLVAIRAYRES